MVSRKDILIAIIVGVATALVWTKVFLYLGTLDFLNIGNGIWGLVIVFPGVLVVGLYLGVFLSRWWKIFVSLSRFAVIGFLNAGIDFGVFNLFMFTTGVERGYQISVFKGVAFIVSNINSYFWNKYWTFEAGGGEHKGKEFAKFLTVSAVGLLVNVGVTSGIIFTIDPQFGFSQLAWNNIAAVVGVISNLIWNFIGYKVVVFKKKDDTMNEYPDQYSK